MDEQQIGAAEGHLSERRRSLTNKFWNKIKLSMCKKNLQFKNSSQNLVRKLGYQNLTSFIAFLTKYVSQSS